jgi:acetyl esterase/lipase
VVAVHCRDRGVKLAAQLLIYPATNLSNRGNPDVEGKYLGPDFARLAHHPRVSPALTPDLTGLAPAILGVGVYDFLYKDNMAYADLLRKAGNKLTLREFPTLNHGFFSYTKVSKASLEAANLLCDDLRRHLHG